MIFRLRGVSQLSQPDYFLRVPEERRRHLSAAGGLPLSMLEEARHTSTRFLKVRGLEAIPALSHAIVGSRIDLGFVDLLSHEGMLDHPLSGPPEELFWRRQLVASTEPPRSSTPVVDQAVVMSVGATFDVKQLKALGNANDIACMGGLPRWFLATLLLPEKATTEEMVTDIF